jgi:hypothetical protein
MEPLELYVQNKEKKSERLDLRVKPSTLEALRLLVNPENYNDVGIDGNFCGDSTSDILEYGLKMLCAAYLKHDSYKHLYPEIEFHYQGLFGNEIVTLHGPHQLKYDETRWREFLKPLKK